MVMISLKSPFMIQSPIWPTTSLMKPRSVLLYRWNAVTTPIGHRVAKRLKQPLM